MDSVTTSPGDRHDAMVIWARRIIVAVVVAALVLVALDAGGPIRALVTALALLVAPGLAASLAMGPMSIEARVLVSLVGSVVLMTAVSLPMALIGSWSPTVGLWIVALVSIALVLVSFLLSGGDAPAHRSGADNWIASAVDTSSQPHGEVGDEGGKQT